MRLDAWNYTYDREERSVLIEKDGVSLSRSWYDSEGRRVRVNDVVDGLPTQDYSELDIVDESSNYSWMSYCAIGLRIAMNRRIL